MPTSSFVCIKIRNSLEPLAPVTTWGTFDRCRSASRPTSSSESAQRRGRRSLRRTRRAQEIWALSVMGAVSGLLWGGLIRIFLLHHVTWSINSICHTFGTRPFDSRDESRNNVFMALLGFGEGWHNGHHAFPASARHGLRWWEIDLSWLVIKFLALVRLARDIKVPSPAQLARRTRTARAGAETG
jgi:hypothetical protein